MTTIDELISKKYKQPKVNYRAKTTAWQKITDTSRWKQAAQEIAQKIVPPVVRGLEKAAPVADKFLNTTKDVLAAPYGAAAGLFSGAEELTRQQLFNEPIKTQDIKSAFKLGYDVGSNTAKASTIDLPTTLIKSGKNTINAVSSLVRGGQDSLDFAIDKYNENLVSRGYGELPRDNVRSLLLLGHSYGETKKDEPVNNFERAKAWYSVLVPTGIDMYITAGIANGAIENYYAKNPQAGIKNIAYKKIDTIDFINNLNKVRQKQGLSQVESPQRGIATTETRITQPSLLRQAATESISKFGGDNVNIEAKSYLNDPLLLKVQKNASRLLKSTNPKDKIKASILNSVVKAQNRAKTTKTSAPKQIPVKPITPTVQSNFIERTAPISREMPNQTVIPKQTTKSVKGLDKKIDKVQQELDITTQKINPDKFIQDLTKAIEREPSTSPWKAEFSKLIEKTRKLQSELNALESQRDIPQVTIKRAAAEGEPQVISDKPQEIKQSAPIRIELAPQLAPLKARPLSSINKYLKQQFGYTDEESLLKIRGILENKLTNANEKDKKTYSSSIKRLDNLLAERKLIPQKEKRIELTVSKEKHALKLRSDIKKQSKIENEKYQRLVEQQKQAQKEIERIRTQQVSRDLEKEKPSEVITRKMTTEEREFYKIEEEKDIKSTLRQETSQYLQKEQFRNQLNEYIDQGKPYEFFADIYNNELLNFLEGKSSWDKSGEVQKILDNWELEKDLPSFIKSKQGQVKFITPKDVPDFLMQQLLDIKSLPQFNAAKYNFVNIPKDITPAYSDWSNVVINVPRILKNYIKLEKGEKVLLDNGSYFKRGNLSLEEAQISYLSKIIEHELKHNKVPIGEAIKFYQEKEYRPIHEQKIVENQIEPTLKISEKDIQNIAKDFWSNKKRVEEQVKSLDLITKDDKEIELPSFLGIKNQIEIPYLISKEAKSYFLEWIDSKILKRYGESGKYIYNHIKLAEKWSIKSKSRPVFELTKELNKLSKEERNNFSDYVKEIKPIPKNAIIAVNLWRKISAQIAEVATTYNTQVKDINGKYSDFSSHIQKNYYPKFVIQEELEKIIKDNNGFRKTVEKMAKQNNISISKAEDILNKIIEVKADFFGHLERIGYSNLPENFYEIDPIKILPNYISEAYNRLSQIKFFGSKNEILDFVIEKARQEGYDYASLRRIVNISLGLQRFEPLAEKTSRAIRDYNNISKLSLAAITNLGDFSKVFVRTGSFSRGLQGIIRSFTKSGKEFAAKSGVIDPELVKYAQEQGMESWASMKFYTLTGFKSIEKKIRSSMANATKKDVDYLFKRLKRNPNNIFVRRRLSQYNLNADDLLEQNEITESDYLDAAIEAISNTQPTSTLDVPPQWRTPLGKVVTQYKQFAYKQGEFLYNFVGKEATKGNFKPLILFLLSVMILGYPIKKMKDYIKKGYSESLPFFKEVVQDFYQIGGIGLASDFIKSMQYSTMSGAFLVWMLGPSFSDVDQFFSSVFHDFRVIIDNKKEFADFGHKTAPNKSHIQLIKKNLYKIPFVGPILTNQLFPDKKSSSGSNLNKQLKTLNYLFGISIAQAEELNVVDKLWTPQVNVQRELTIGGRKYPVNIKTTIIPAEKIRAVKTSFYNLSKGQTDNNPGIGAFGKRMSFGDVAMPRNWPDYSKIRSASLKGKDILIKVPKLEDIKTPYGQGVFRVNDTTNKRINKLDFVSDNLTSQVDTNFERKVARSKVGYYIINREDLK